MLRSTLNLQGLGNVDQKMVELSEKRLAQMGETESGLYNYYLTRVGHGTMLNQDDLMLIEYLSENEEIGCRILEVAAGCGQVSFALEELGFGGLEFCECGETRLAYGEALKAGLGSNVGIHGCDYRTMELNNYDLVFVANAATSGLGVNDLSLLSGVISSGTDVILKYGYYGMDNLIFDALQECESIAYEVIFTTNQEFRRYTAITREGIVK